MPPDRIENWQPLLDFLKDEKEVSHFMFMITDRQEGNEVFLYKHCDTRRYLFLDKYGNCFRYASEGMSKYVPVTRQEALTHVYS